MDPILSTGCGSPVNPYVVGIETLDSGIGSDLYYDKQTYALLLTALTSGKTVSITTNGIIDGALCVAVRVRIRSN